MDGGDGGCEGVQVSCGTCVPCWRPELLRQWSTLNRDPWTKNLGRRKGSAVGNGTIQRMID